MKWNKKKASFLSSPVSKEADTLEDLERKLLGKSPNEIFALFFDKEMLNSKLGRTLSSEQKVSTIWSL